MTEHNCKRHTRLLSVRHSARIFLLAAALGSAAQAQQDARSAAPGPASIPEADSPSLLGKHSLDAARAHFAPGTGLVLESDDELFELALRLRAQPRYTLSLADGTAAQESSQLRRARLQFKGHAFGKHNKLKVELAFAPRDVGQRDDRNPTTSPLLDWYFTFDHLRDLTLRVGQYKVPYNRQRVVSSGDLQLVDRSIVNAEFNLDRDIGIDLRSKDLGGLGWLRYSLGVYAGEGRNGSGLHELGLAYMVRLEALPFGAFKDYREVDFERSPNPKLSLGAAYAKVHEARGALAGNPADGGTTDFDGLTWDLVFRYRGLSVTSEWAWRTGTRNPGDATLPAQSGDEVPVPTEAPRDGIGGMLQVGYLLPTLPLEVAARVGTIRQTGKDSSLTERGEYGGGVSYYFAEHSFKVQADYFRLTEREPGAESTDVDEMRVQLQSAF